MLRRGRALNKISLEHYAATFMKVEVHHYIADIISSIRVWDNTPILNVYFDDSVIESEMFTIRRQSSLD